MLLYPVDTQAARPRRWTSRRRMADRAACREAKTIPFLTSKFSDILQRFSMDPNSADALIVRHTLKDCKRGAN
ncbi:hypothetical protein EJ110_NYTH10943 [Nymphaea thermarum]|nr:hypothetical protein EJ110_NYTH10943 [Nymphaea thermarum]